MALFKASVILAFTLLYVTDGVFGSGKIACFYNSKAASRKDLAKVTPEELKPALSACNYLVYGYIGLDKDYKAESLDKNLDTEKGQNNFKKITELKQWNPALKVLLSVGGFHDTDTPEKYLKALEKTDHRSKFITSLVELVKKYGFDGADLAWQFPVVKEKKERSTIGSIWHSIKKTVSFSTKDEHEKEHKEQFTALVRELTAALRGNKHILTMSVLPHVNKEAYFDGPGIKDWIEHIHLLTYDFRTPERSEEQADYAAPTHQVGSRLADQNIEGIVKWWLEQKIPAQKLLIAVPTFGRTWKLTSDSNKNGEPPIKADGPGEQGSYLKEEGTMAYYEICPTLTTATTNVASTLLRKVSDSTNRLGSYAWRYPASKVKGIWISYEDPEVAGKKAYYAKLKGLGGVAVVDLSLDDFKGSCTAALTKFPILQAVKLNL